jgi:hypothetical protein
MKLLISQKDALFDLIEMSGFSPHQFQQIEVKSKYNSENSFELRFNNSEYFFLFDFSNGKYMQRSCPGEYTYLEKGTNGTWDEQFASFGNWLQYLKREITAPNKWERLRVEMESLNIQFNHDEDKFTVVEYEDVVAKINVLKQQLGTIGLLPDQVAAISNKLDHLTEYAKTMNKFDWKGLFVGTMISIVIQLEVNHENANALWRLIKRIFNTYFLP